jgi:capsular polysaccharide biosynthesis protein
VTAKGDDPANSAAVANAVADAFIEGRSRDERARLESTRALLKSALATGGAAQSTRRRTLDQELVQLDIAIASAGKDLRVAERASPSRDPVSPNPLVAVVLTAAACMFAGVLVALAWDRLAGNPAPDRSPQFIPSGGPS